MRRKRLIIQIFGTILATFFAILFLYPTVVTICDSFMSTTEIMANYGKVFENKEEDDSGWWNPDNEENDTTFKKKDVSIKLRPKKVTVSQYAAVLFKSPAYLFKFWNSVKLVVPILIFQILVALGASYSFARFRGRLKEIVFFLYMILMLMRY